MGSKANHNSTNFAFQILEESRKKEKEDAIKERQDLLKQIEEYKRLETEHLNRLRSKNRNYQEDLVQQIKFQQRKKDIEIDETRREIQSLQVIFDFHLSVTFEYQPNYLIIILVSMTINLLFCSLSPLYLL